MKDDHDTDQGENQPMRKGRLWFWFTIGFLIVFVGTSLAVTMYSMRPSGDAVVACKLWQYYLIEIPRTLSSHSTLRPASGNTSAVAMTAFQHFLCSVAGGAGMMGIGWIFYKVGDKRQRQKV